MDKDRIREHKQRATERIPVKYRQPAPYVGRKVKDTEELVDYVPGTHLRIWYNNQLEGYEMHHHAATEIILCVENGYTVMTGSRNYVLSAGDILFIPPHILHRLMGGVEGVRFIFQFDLAPLAMFRDFKVLDPVMMAPLYLPRSSGSELYYRIHELLMQITETYFSAKSMWELSIYATLFDVYTTIGQDYYAQKDSFSPTQSSHHQVNYDKFASLLSYMDEHYADDFTLDEAADFVGFSKYHFTRLFREYTGTTFLDYLTHKRVQAAQSLLASDLSVTEICFRTGFNNLTSFSRSFKKYTGMSPSDFRALSESYQDHISLFTEFRDGA